MSPEASGGSESTLSRLGEGRDLATKEANRFFIFGLAFALLYTAKTAGYDLDKIFLNRDLGNVKNGSFIYLVVAQISMILCMIRTADSLAFEKSITNLLKDQLDPDGKNISEIFPNAREWLSPISTKIRKIPSGGGWLFAFNITSLVTTLLSFGCFLFPVIAGFYYIGNPSELHFSTSPDVELTIVIMSTSLCALWIINGIGVLALLSRTEVWGRQKNGDSVPRR